MPYYVMTNNDYDKVNRDKWDENEFDAGEDLDQAITEAEFELMADAEDTTYKTFIVDSDGNIVAKRWMEDKCIKRRDYAPGATLSRQERKIQEAKRRLETVINGWLEDKADAIRNNDSLSNTYIQKFNDDFIVPARQALQFLVQKAGE